MSILDRDNLVEAIDRLEDSLGIRENILTKTF